MKHKYSSHGQVLGSSALLHEGLPPPESVLQKVIFLSYFSHFSDSNKIGNHRIRVIFLVPGAEKLRKLRHDLGSRHGDRCLSHGMVGAERGQVRLLLLTSSRNLSFPVLHEKTRRKTNIQLMYSRNRINEIVFRLQSILDHFILGSLIVIVANVPQVKTHKM